MDDSRSPRPDSFQDRIDQVRGRITAAAVRSGRRDDEITLVAITKGVRLERVAESTRLGVTDLGESRVQEAGPKIAALAARVDLPRLRWHLVGHLQRNKVRQAASLFSVIHSVDSESLAADLSARTKSASHASVDILLQVNIAAEPRKFGVSVHAAPAVLREIVGLPGLRVVGLMTIAPQTDNPETVRPVFRRLRELHEAVRASGIVDDEFAHLSMGMSDDFEVAVEEGATMVRVGRAIFGSRP